MGYLIGSLQIGHHHLDLIGPEKDIFCYYRGCDVAYTRLRNTACRGKQGVDEWISESREEKVHLDTSRACACETVQREHI